MAKKKVKPKKLTREEKAWLKEIKAWIADMLLEVKDYDRQMKGHREEIASHRQHGTLLRLQKQLVQKRLVKGERMLHKWEKERSP